MILLMNKMKILKPKMLNRVQTPKMKMKKRPKMNKRRLLIILHHSGKTQTRILNLMERGKARWSYSMIIWKGLDTKTSSFSSANRKRVVAKHLLPLLTLITMRITSTVFLK